MQTAELLNKLQSAWADFNFGLALIILLAYVIIDGLNAHYTYRVTKRKPFAAATTGSIMYFIIAFGVLNYVGNFLYIIPLAMGSWIGTYLVVDRERRSFLKPPGLK